MGGSDLCKDPCIVFTFGCIVFVLKKGNGYIEFICVVLCCYLCVVLLTGRQKVRGGECDERGYNVCMRACVCVCGRRGNGDMVYW